MDDEELDGLLARAAEEWRVPRDPPLDQIWRNVDAAMVAQRRRFAPGWGVVGIAAAAALVIGVAGGRLTARTASPSPRTGDAAVAVMQARSGPTDDPNHRAMADLVGRTALLLAVLPRDSNTASALDTDITREGARLLTTTRLLLDSPVGNDPRLHNLLQDLELVLAQIARIEPKHPRRDMQFIRTALDEHDIVPRLRSAAADLSLDDF